MARETSARMWLTSASMRVLIKLGGIIIGIKIAVVIYVYMYMILVSGHELLYMVYVFNCVSIVCARVCVCMCVYNKSIKSDTVDVLLWLE